MALAISRYENIALPFADWKSFFVAPNLAKLEILLPGANTSQGWRAFLQIDLSAAILSLTTIYLKRVEHRSKPI
ncbi:MAG: hypothetical protein ACJATW_001529 [Glaciecola sp.]